ncbi:MAG: hypothetical protein LBL04_11965 [Bacteroidales bacterium]|jgi:hypothetical protein|nr:hypothetical protein [Bacteroidales bacterium]
MEDLKKLKNRIDWFCANRINAFSPTISPAPKSLQRNEIESIYEGVRYFFERGVTEIVVQRKYMGSYCDIYLHKNPDETYFVSRNGYKLSHINIDRAREACHTLHGRFNWTNLQMAIIQSELMPWSALGKGLIENEFGGYLNVHLNHYEHLSQSGLYAKIAAVKQSQPYREYMDYKAAHTAKELKEHYPAHVVRQYDSLTAFKALNLEEYKKYIDIYAAQIAHFGVTGDLYFKPFNILKKIFDDGSEQIVNDNLSYREVNDDECLYLPIGNEEEMNRSVEVAYNWFAQLESENEEGIVIKPVRAFIKNLPPAFKVRNNQYLVMIYGIDFRTNYAHNLHKRKIGRKLECSINDWMLNWEMLKVKYADIHKENYYLKNLVFDRIMGEQAEASLDTRL